MSVLGLSAFTRSSGGVMVFPDRGAGAIASITTLTWEYTRGSGRFLGGLYRSKRDPSSGAGHTLTEVVDEFRDTISSGPQTEARLMSPTYDVAAAVAAGWTHWIAIGADPSTVYSQITIT